MAEAPLRQFAGTEAEKISIVIVTRNREALLRRAIASVIAQDYRPIEIIVVDNASDESVSIDAGEISVTIHRNRTMLSASKNRNKGIELATGEFVCFLDDDDFSLPGKLSKLAAMSSDVAYGNTRMVGPDGKHIGMCSGPPVLATLMRYRYMHLNSLMVRRSVLESVRFDERMTTYEDVDFVFRLLRQHTAKHCDETLAVWNCDKRPDQLTRRNYARSRKNWLILCERFALEINRHPVLAKFYYRKMFLLSAIKFRPFDALLFFVRFMRFGYLCFPPKSPQVGLPMTGT